MSTPKTILVPVDFSETSSRALDFAVALAEQLTATLHLVHVVPNPHEDPWLPEASSIDIGSLLETWKADAQRQLQKIKPKTVAAELVTVAGSPSRAIADYAREHTVDLIVIGTHGRSGIQHALLGSVAERVIRTASCPVLTVR